MALKALFGKAASAVAAVFRSPPPPKKKRRRRTKAQVKAGKARRAERERGRNEQDAPAVPGLGGVSLTATSHPFSVGPSSVDSSSNLKASGAPDRRVSVLAAISQPPSVETPSNLDLLAAFGLSVLFAATSRTSANTSTSPMTSTAPGLGGVSLTATSHHSSTTSAQAPLSGVFQASASNHPPAVTTPAVSLDQSPLSDVPRAAALHSASTECVRRSKRPRSQSPMLAGSSSPPARAKRPRLIRSRATQRLKEEDF